MARVTLIEAQPRDAATGLPVAVRLAGGGRRHYRHRGRADWIAGVVNPPLTQAALGFDGGFTGGGIAEVGAIGFMPAHAAARARVAGLVWTDAPIAVLTGDDALAEPDWTVVLAGKVAGYAVQAGLFTFTVANLAGRLADPVATAAFTGAGGIEGDPAATGRIKRRSWGRVWNVEARLLDAASNVYEVGDPGRPLHSIDAVKDMGRPGEIDVVGWAGSAAATLAALKAAAAPRGGAAVAPSIACIKWYTRPVVLTADLRGEVGAGYAETVAGIAAAISAAVGGPEAEPLAAAIAARPEPAGIHVGDAGETGVALLDRLLLRASMAWGVTPAGLLSIAPLRLDDPVATVRAAAPADREAVFAPVARVSVGWRRNHRIHAAAEISAAVLGGEVAWPDILDPDGTKPADNADVTGENTSKDTNAVGGTPAIEVLGRLTTLETETIPTVESAVAEAGGRITAARAAADAARVRADQAIDDIAAEIDRALGSEADIHQRIDSISASGGYDDTAIKVEVKRVDETAISRDAARGRQIDAVSVSLTQADSDNRAETKRVDEAAVSRDSALTRRADEAVASITAVDAAWKAETSRIETQAVNRDGATNQRIDDLVAEGGGGSEGVDSVARAEIRRVETASVSRDGALGQRIDTIGSSIDTVDSRIAAKAQEVTTAYTRLTDALASRSASLEASASAASGAVNPNQDFRVWPAAQEFPTNYFLWGTPAGIARAADGININNNNQDGGIAANVEQIAAGWYVYEAQVYLHTYASFLNTGLTMNVLNDAGQHAGAFISHHFYEDAGHGAQDRWYHFSRLVQVPDLPDRRLGKVAFHVMGRWASFSGGATSTNNTTWRFARVRPASDAEIKAGKADATLIPALSARIKTAEDTLIDLPDRYATAQRATMLEAQLANTADSGLRTGMAARIEDRATVIANAAAGAVAQTVQTLRTEYNGTVQEVSDQRGVLNGLNGKTAAYVRIVADAGNGRAALSLWSDQYGGAWQLVGNGIISGDLTVDGTITARKFNGASMAREGRTVWSGSITPASGQTVTVPWSLTLPSIPPTGRFIYEYVARIDTNAGTSVYAGVEGSKAVTIHYVDDGGLTLRAVDGQGNVYTPRPNASDRVIATTDFTPSFGATMRRGVRDERVDGGDYIDRYVSATYTLTSIDLKVTWVAI